MYSSLLAHEIIHLIPTHIHPLSLFILLTGLGVLPIQEELLILSAGYAASASSISPITTALIGALSVILMDNFWFFVGRRENRLYRKIKKLISEEKFARYESVAKKESGKIAFAVQFLTGGRIITLLLLGGAKIISIRKFWLWNSIAGALYGSTMILLGFYLRDHIKKIFLHTQLISIVIVSLIILYILIKLIIYRRKKNYKR